MFATSRRVRSGGRATCVLLTLLVAVCRPAHGQDAAAMSFRTFIPGAIGRPSTAVVPLPNAEVVVEINARRRAAGCAEVQSDGALAGAAARHSSDMAINNFVGHKGSDGSSFDQRAREAGYTAFASGEVVAAGYPTPEATVEGWMSSPPHRAIMLDCANTDVGAALVERSGSSYGSYWTAVFGQR